METIRSYHNKKVNKMKKIKRYIFLTLAVLAVISVFVFVRMYKAIIFPNVSTPNEEKISLYIYSDDDFEDVKEKLYSDNIIINQKSFEWLAKKMDYPKYIKLGH